nr:hypothetical protein [Tanacetum cinerariifolium]
MNKNCCNSNSFDFDKIQPSQYYVMHQPPEETIKEFEKQLKTAVITALEGVIQPPQETSVEILQDRGNLVTPPNCYFDVHQPPKEISIDELNIMMQSYFERMNQKREQEALLAAQREQELLAQKQAAQEKEETPQSSDFRQLIREIRGTKIYEEQKQNMEDTMLELLEVYRKKSFIEKHEVKNIVEQPTKCRTRITESLQNFRVIHKMRSISNTSRISSVIAIAPVLPTEEPGYSISIGDEHLSTIPKTESDEVTKSSVEKLVPIPSKSEVTSDNESECDVPINDESSLIFTTFSNHLFDCNNDFTSSDDESLSNEDVPMENFKIYSNPLFDDEEIISSKIDRHYFNAESNLLESLLNRDTLIDFSPKLDFLLKEFSGKLAHIDPIPPGIKEADFDLEE